MSTSMHMHTYINWSKYRYRYIYTYTYTHMFKYTYTHIYLYICMHMYTYIYKTKDRYVHIYLSVYGPAGVNIFVDQIHKTFQEGNAWHRNIIHLKALEDTYVAVCRSVLQCVAVCCRVLQWFNDGYSKSSSVSRHRETHVLQCVAVCCSVLQCVAVCCGVCHICDMPKRRLSRGRSWETHR